MVYPPISGRALKCNEVASVVSPPQPTWPTPWAADRFTPMLTNRKWPSDCLRRHRQADVPACRRGKESLRWSSCTEASWAGTFDCHILAAFPLYKYNLGAASRDVHLGQSSDSSTVMRQCEHASSCIRPNAKSRQCDWSQRSSPGWCTQTDATGVIVEVMTQKLLNLLSDVKEWCTVFFPDDHRAGDSPCLCIQSSRKSGPPSLNRASNDKVETASHQYPSE